MKIEICTKEPSIKDPEITPVHPEALGEVENGSCEFVRLGQILDQFRNRREVFEVVKNKVRYGGKIVVSGLDLGTVALNIVNGQFTNDQVNTVLYESSTSISDLKEMSDLLTGWGFDIVKQRFDGSTYFIEAVRPKPNE